MRLRLPKLSSFVRFISRKGSLEFMVAAGVSGAVILMKGPYIETFARSKMSGSWYQYLLKDTPEPGLILDTPHISQRLSQLIEDVKRDMDFVPEDCKKRLQFWPTFSVFPKAFGSSQVKWGKAVVLLPDYLNVSCVQDMTSVKLNQLLEKEFNWTVPSNQMWLTGAGRLLVDSFIISEKAKKYLIAREMCSTLHNDIYSSGFGVFSWIYVYFLSAAGMQSWFTPPGLVVSFPVFILSQMLSCLVAWSGLYLTETLLHHRNQRNGDALALSRGFKRLHELEELANINRPYSLDPDYYEGALEVYQKEIQRNQSMRHLMMADSQINHCDTFWNRKYVVFRDDGVYRRSSFDPMVSPVDRLNHIKAWKRGRKKPKWAKTFDEIDEATRIQHEEEIRHEKQMQQQREHSQQVPDAS